MSVSRPSLGRIRRLAAVIGRHLLIGILSSRCPSALARFLPTSWARAWRRWAELGEPERLRMLFEELGGSFLKLGQMLALQPDVLPRDYCDALYDLLDRVPPISATDVERVFVRELGASAHRVFDHFEVVPIASASIGQVHVAWKDNRKLAVKVQRPTAERDFGGDSRILELLARCIESWGPERFRFLVEPMREVVEWTRDELDYRREAEFLEAMGRSFEKRPHQTVPRVEERLSTRRVLTMEFMEGLSLLDYLRALDAGDRITLRRLADIGFDPEIFAARIIENFLEQAFVDGVFHADLHPANLMILPHNTVGYLDLGITGTLGIYSRRQLAAMTLAYTRGDIDGMCRAFGGVSDADAEGLERYRRGLLRLAEDWYERSGGGLRLRKSVSMVMLDMLRLSAETEVWAQRDVIKYIRSSVATDGLITRCAPRVDVGRHLGLACRRHMASLIGGSAVAGGRSAEGWLSGSIRGIGQLLRGGQRSVALLDRLSRGELPSFAVELAPAESSISVAKAERSAPSTTRPARSLFVARPIELGLVLVALLLLVPSGADPLAFVSPNFSLETLPLMGWVALSIPFLRYRAADSSRRKSR